MFKNEPNTSFGYISAPQAHTEKSKGFAKCPVHATMENVLNPFHFSMILHITVARSKNQNQKIIPKIALT